MFSSLVQILFLHADWSVCLLMTYTERFIPAKNMNVVCFKSINLKYLGLFHLNFVFSVDALGQKSTHEECLYTRVTSLRSRSKIGTSSRLLKMDISGWFSWFKKLETQNLTSLAVDYHISTISIVKPLKFLGKPRNFIRFN